MALLVLSDIHGNIDALDAVLADAAGAYTDAVCLGDLVGYGAEPSAVIARVRDLQPAWLIRGNHDRVAAGLTHASTFSPTARTAIEWTQRQLSGEERQWLASIDVGPVDLAPDVLLCHGSPFDEDYYVLHSSDARMVFSGYTFRVCLHGHTHLPTVYRLDGRVLTEETPLRRARHTIALDADARWLLNPGSVGQPRDGDSRAAYALLDIEAGTFELRRVVYDVETAQRRIRDAGLPRSLAGRLATGD